MRFEQALGFALVAFLFGLWGGIIVSKYIEQEKGTEIAEKYNTPILIGLAIFVLLSFSGRYFISSVTGLFMLFSLTNYFVLGIYGVWFSYVLWKRWRLTADEVLLDAGRNIRIFVLLVGAYFGFNIIRGLIEYFMDGGNPNPDLPFVILLVGLFIASLIAVGFSKVYLTKEGIFLFRLTPIKWERIRDYTWGFRNKNRVILLLKVGKRVEFNIAKEHKEEVESILQAKVKGLETEADGIEAYQS
jgi:hypothetical protein